MADLFLIAHLVRGEPAFDIAEQIPCAKCVSWYANDSRYDFSCDECNDERHWWIIPTSGHRAYPYWSVKLQQETIDGISALVIDGHNTSIYLAIPPIPPNLPDHYANQPAAPGRGLTDLSFLRPKLPTITRRL